MLKFLELPVSEDDDAHPVMVNIACIGRVYANPQSTLKCIVELNYQSINDAPVYLEVDLPYEKVKSLLVASSA